MARVVRIADHVQRPDGSAFNLERRGLHRSAAFGAVNHVQSRRHFTPTVRLTACGLAPPQNHGHFRKREIEDVVQQKSSPFEG